MFNGGVEQTEIEGDFFVRLSPEDVVLVAQGGVEGTLYGAENHGSEIIAVIQAGGHLLRATVAAKTPMALNQPVQVSFAQDKLHFFHPQTGEKLRPSDFHP